MTEMVRITVHVSLEMKADLKKYLINARKVARKALEAEVKRLEAEEKSQGSS